MLPRNATLPVLGTPIEFEGGTYGEVTVYDNGTLASGTVADDFSLPFGGTSLTCASGSIELWPDASLRSAELREAATLKQGERTIEAGPGIIDFFPSGILQSCVLAEEAALAVGDASLPFESGKRIVFWDSGSVRFGDPARTPRGPGPARHLACTTSRPRTTIRST